MFSRKIISSILFLFIFIFSGCLTLTQLEENKGQNKQREQSRIPDDGHIRLVLNDKTGSFSLYYLSDPKSIRYEPLFNVDEPLASFLSVNIDGKVYHLGNSKQFQTKIDRINGEPALVFESTFVKVIQLFTPVKTSGSDMVNGVMITIKVQNISPVKSAIGVRMLLDTNLGEGRRRVPFLTNTQVITSEMLLDGHSNELFWISRGSKVSLMGSIVNPEGTLGKGPDLVHIANWKRLNDTPWKLVFVEGRTFNNLPHSIGDSAVCYYFGPEILDRDIILTYTIFLTTEDLTWYKLSSVPAHITNARTAASSTSKTTTTIVAANTTAAAASKTTAATASKTATTAAANTAAGAAANTTTAAAASKPAGSAAQPAEQATAVVSTELVSTAESSINIPAIEVQAQYEAASKNESADTLTLIKLQEILNQFINGQIFLSEKDLTEIERAIERHRTRN